MAPQFLKFQKIDIFSALSLLNETTTAFYGGYELAQLQGLRQSKNADPAAAAACAAGAFSKPTEDLARWNFLGDAESKFQVVSTMGNNGGKPNILKM